MFTKNKKNPLKKILILKVNYIHINNYYNSKISINRNLYINKLKKYPEKFRNLLNSLSSNLLLKSKKLIIMI